MLMHLGGYLYIIFWFIIFTVNGSGSTSSDLPARSLDNLLQHYAFRELTWRRTRTGIPYDGKVPSNLAGIRISALMLTRYSLKWGVYGYYKEFFIPSGIIEEAYVWKLVLVYQNLANWSSFYYPLPGYTYLTPILGILPYDACDLYASNVPELDIVALEEPISIRFPYVQPAPEGSLSKCVYFYSNNWVEFGNVTDGNVCFTRRQGHFAIVTEVKVAPSPPPAVDDIAPTPSPAAAADGIAPSPSPAADENNHQKINSKLWTISLAFLIFALCVILFVIINKCLLEIRQRLDDSETVVEPLLRNTRAPLPSEPPYRPFGMFLGVIVKKFGLLEIRQRLDDSAAMVEPLFGNTEAPFESSTRPLPENDYMLAVKRKL